MRLDREVPVVRAELYNLTLDLSNVWVGAEANGIAAADSARAVRLELLETLLIGMHMTASVRRTSRILPDEVVGTIS